VIVKKFNRPINPRDIATLLAQLKAREAAYPASLLAARRVEFLKKAASIPLYGGHGPNNTETRGNSSSNTGHASSAGKSLSSGVQTASHTLNGILYAVVGVLTTVILAEVGYLYRDEIREFLVPESGEVVSSETLPSPLSSPSETSETPSSSPTPSPTITGTSTQSPLLPLIHPSQTPQPAKTSVPGIIPTSTHGLHLGQTKTPKP
jgi:hypothetical protein